MLYSLSMRKKAYIDLENIRKLYTQQLKTPGGYDRELLEEVRMDLIVNFQELLEELIADQASDVDVEAIRMNISQLEVITNESDAVVMTAIDLVVNSFHNLLRQGDDFLLLYVIDPKEREKANELFNTIFEQVSDQLAPVLKKMEEEGIGVPLVDDDGKPPSNLKISNLSMRKKAQVKAFYVSRLYELEYKMSRLEQKEELTDSENVYYLKMKNEINTLLDYTFQKIYHGLEGAVPPEATWDDPSTPSRMKALTRKMKKVENKSIKERIVVLQEVISSAHDIDLLWEWVITSPGEDELAEVFESDPEILAKWDEELKKLQLSSEYRKYKKEKEVKQEDILDYCRDQINKVLDQDFENWKNKVAEEWSDNYIAQDLGHISWDKFNDSQEKDVNEFFDLLQLPDKEKYEKYYKEVFDKIVDENVDYWSEYERKKQETLNGAIVRATQLVDQGYNNEEVFSIILEEFDVKEKDFANSIWSAMTNAGMTLSRDLLASNLSMRKKAYIVYDDKGRKFEVSS